MAADQLATPQDLASLLQLTWASLTVAQQATLTMLVELATAKVQRAAGGQRIVDATSTDATIDVTRTGEWLTLPQHPVRTVTAVKLDGVAITDWRLVDQRLWRALGWLTSLAEPSRVLVTYSHGYQSGAQWLQLGRDMTLSLGRAGWGNPTGATAEAIDDYRVTYAEADARMVLTEWQERAIADAYGIPAYVTESL